MAYVDHAFSITDEDMMMEHSYAVNNKPPIKETILAVSLVVFGVVGIVLGFFMAASHFGSDTAHGLFFAILGAILFLLGFYYTRIAYYVYKGYKGFSFSNIHPVQCCQQVGGLECGLYVMNYMYEVLSSCSREDDDLEKVYRSPREGLLTEEEHNEIRDKWAKYFTSKCME